MRVKLEQASKVKLRMPTPLRLGEGRAGREETDKHLFRSAGVVSTACSEGGLGNWGEIRSWWRSQLQCSRKGGGQSGSRRGPYDRGNRVMPVEGRALTSGVLLKEQR